MPGQDHVIPARPRPTPTRANTPLPDIHWLESKSLEESANEPGGVKRTWDKVKGIAPQIFPRKKQKANDEAIELEAGGRSPCIGTKYT
jgi:hypothetical protein